MVIKELTLLTGDLISTEEFYTKTVGLAVLERRATFAASPPKDLLSLHLYSSYK